MEQLEVVPGKTNENIVPAGQPPRVTVFMPVFNGERFLEQAIRSILDQTFTDFEFLIINDGSTDRSDAIVRSFSDPRVRYVPNPCNLGIVKSRNLGLDMAEGEYVAMLDSDDMALPERLAAQVNYLNEHPEVGACGTDYSIIDDKGDVLVSYKMPRTAREVRSALLLKNCICNSSVMVRTDLLRKLRYREEVELAEDYDLWYRMSRVADIVNIPLFGIRYRIHATNVSVTKGAEMDQFKRRMARDILTNAGLSFTQEEFEALARFLGGDVRFAHDRESLDLVIKSFGRIYDELEKDDRYDALEIGRIMIKRMLDVFFASRKVGPSVLVNGFSRRFPALYAGLMLQFMQEKLSKKVWFY